MTQSNSDSAAKRKSSGSSTSRSLLERLHEHDAAAWRELVHLYTPLIAYWCQRQGLPTHECEDVLQDVFRTVVTNMGQFRKEKSSDTFRGWFRTITRSRVADHFRRKAGEPRAAGGTEARRRLNQLAGPSSEPEDSSSESTSCDADISPDEADVNRQIYLRAIEMIRHSFEEPTWQAFWRVAVDGLTAQEVAEELGMRPGTVRVAKSRVLKRLREQLGDSLD